MIVAPERAVEMLVAFDHRCEVKGSVHRTESPHAVLFSLPLEIQF